ncbi:MAG: hypothetical protein JKY56_07895 [Kofleriaceae bacterium]|nr:hypothetical protein [Kofleriaceae bacterium]
MSGSLPQDRTNGFKTPAMPTTASPTAAGIRKLSNPSARSSTPTIIAGRPS